MNVSLSPRRVSGIDRVTIGVHMPVLMIVAISLTSLVWFSSAIAKSENVGLSDEQSQMLELLFDQGNNIGRTILVPRNPKNSSVTVDVIGFDKLPFSIGTIDEVVSRSNSPTITLNFLPTADEPSVSRQTALKYDKFLNEDGNMLERILGFGGRFFDKASASDMSRTLVLITPTESRASTNGFVNELQLLREDSQSKYSKYKINNRCQIESIVSNNRTRIIYVSVSKSNVDKRCIYTSVYSAFGFHAIDHIYRSPYAFDSTDGAPLLGFSIILKELYGQSDVEADRFRSGMTSNEVLEVLRRRNKEQ
jgi:hypothetical protein